MIILNSVNDFKSFFLKKMLDYKGLTYVNLEYSENNNADYSEDSTGVVYISSPVNDSERMISKKMTSVLKKEERSKNINIYVEKEEVEYFADLYSKKDVVLKAPHVIVKFLDDLCNVPQIYPTAMDKRYLIYQFEVKYYEQIFSLMFNLEKSILKNTNKPNGFTLKKEVNKPNPDFSNQEMVKSLKEILNMINKDILPYAKKMINRNFFYFDKINSIEILTATMIERLLELKLINHESLDNLLWEKYKSVVNILKKRKEEDKDHLIVNYKNINLQHLL